MIVPLLGLLGTAVNADGPTCQTPLYFGELRSAYLVNECIDVAGSDGIGQLWKEHCLAAHDNQWSWCSDGSIRNQMNNFCLTYEMNGDQITGNLFSQGCQFDIDDNLHDVNKWQMGSKEVEVDKFGIEQMAFVIQPVAHRDWCITLYTEGFLDNKGGVQLNKCYFEQEQYWFFKEYGQELAWGRLVSWEADDRGQVLDVSGQDGVGNVVTYEGESEAMDQVWAHYENGQIVNQKSFRCLNIEGTEGKGNVQIDPCDYEADTQWTLDRQVQNQNDKTYVTLINRKKEGQSDQKCVSPVDDDAYRSEVWAEDCVWSKPQYFYWDDNTSWSVPDSSYVGGWCDMNGVVERTITVTTEFGAELTDEVTTEVAATIGIEMKFLESSVTTTVATSTSKAFSASAGFTSSTKYDCSWYDDGTPWAGGCMWQFSLETFKDGQKLRWDSQMIRCTKGTEMPRCPPFEVCTDLECTKCQPSTFNLPVRSRSKPRPTKNGKFREIPETTKTVAFKTPPEPMKTYQDYRNTAKCKSLKTEDSCGARGDCKVKMKKGVMKCKPLSCRRIMTADACLRANRKCQTFFKFGKFKKCMKAGDDN